MVSPFFGIGSSTVPSNTKEDDTRQKEFENTIGNLLVAEYQCHRLRERVRSHLVTKMNISSEFMFKINEEWFRINVSAQKQVETREEEPEEKTKEAPTPSHGFEAWFPDEENVGVP